MDDIVRVLKLAQAGKAVITNESHRGLLNGSVKVVNHIFIYGEGLFLGWPQLKGVVFNFP